MKKIILRIKKFHNSKPVIHLLYISNDVDEKWLTVAKLRVKKLNLRYLINIIKVNIIFKIILELKLFVIFVPKSKL